MTNSDVIKNFLRKKNARTNLREIQNGYYTYKGRTLRTQNDNIGFSLINYSTRIAFILNDTLYINTQKYSVTTSKIQSQLNYQASMTDYKIVKYNNESEVI